MKIRQRGIKSMLSRHMEIFAYSSFVCLWTSIKVQWSGLTMQLYHVTKKYCPVFIRGLAIEKWIWLLGHTVYTKSISIWLASRWNINWLESAWNLYLLSAVCSTASRMDKVIRSTNMIIGNTKKVIKFQIGRLSLVETSSQSARREGWFKTGIVYYMCPSKLHC